MKKVEQCTQLLELPSAAISDNYIEPQWMGRWEGIHLREVGEDREARTHGGGEDGRHIHFGGGGKMGRHILGKGGEDGKAHLEERGEMGRHIHFGEGRGRWEGTLGGERGNGKAHTWCKRGEDGKAHTLWGREGKM